MPWRWSPPSSGKTTGHSCHIAKDRRRETAYREAIGVDARRHGSHLQSMVVVSLANPVNRFSCETEMWSRRAPGVCQPLPGAPTTHARRCALGRERRGDRGEPAPKRPSRRASTSRRRHGHTERLAEGRLSTRMPWGFLQQSQNGVQNLQEVMIKR